MALALGKFVGRLSSLGFAVQQDAVLEMLSTEILESAAIEGERLNRKDVRSSVAKRMELLLSAPAAETTHATEARVDMLLRRWFLTLHPFDDGNGRLARALTEYLLAKGEQSELRFYSLSAQIQQEKPDYYNELERAQRGEMDVTRWIAWFLRCHLRAIQSAETQLAGLLAKSFF